MLLQGEENNNDSGHNRFYTAMAGCALMWAAVRIFWHGNLTQTWIKIHANEFKIAPDPLRAHIS